MCLVNHTLQTLARRATRAAQAQRTTSQSSALTLFGFHLYTGQRSYLDDFGLHYYVARWYDPATAHFAQVDSIIPQPGNSGDWDWYAYVLFNPFKYLDPSGHSWIVATVVAVVAVDEVSVEAYDVETPKPSSENIAGWTIERIQENSNTTDIMQEAWSGSVAEQAGCMKAWITLVRSGGEWDYKHDPKEADFNGDIIFGGITTNYQAIANLTYGFMGTVIGMSSNLLEWVAGIFQIINNAFGNEGILIDTTYIDNFESNFDDPFDNWWVKFGVYLREQIGVDYAVANRRSDNRITKCLHK